MKTTRFQALRGSRAELEFRAEGRFLALAAALALAACGAAEDLSRVAEDLPVVPPAIDEPAPSPAPGDPVSPPVDPVEPVDPVDPIDPVDPVDPSSCTYPGLSAELRVSASAELHDILWDGRDFVVAMDEAGAKLGRRVDPRDGAVRGDVTFDPRMGGLAFAPVCPVAGGEGGCYLVVTSEPGRASGEASSDHDYTTIAGFYVSRDGARLTAKTTLAADPGTSCPPESLEQGIHPDLYPSDVAGSSNGFFLTVTAACGWPFGVALPSGARTYYESNYRPRGPMVAQAPSGFAVLNEELWVGGGRNEIWGYLVEAPNMRQLGYHAVQSYTPHAFPVVASYDIVAGRTGFLMTYDRAGQTYEIVDAQLRPTGTKLALDGQFGTYDAPRMVFDGTSYFAVLSASGSTLKGARISESAQLLDASPIDLTLEDGSLESRPRLATDGAGRLALAYAKSSDRGVYVRLFTTCP